jgi:hypothetical protein
MTRIQISPTMNPLEKLTEAQKLLAQIGRHLLSTRTDADLAARAGQLIHDAKAEIEAELARQPKS